MGELSQISNAGIPIYDALAEVLGVDVPEAQSMASAGAVELEHVLEALSGEAGTWFPALLEGAEDVSNTLDRKSTRLNSSHVAISYAVFCLKKISSAVTETATLR